MAPAERTAGWPLPFLAESRWARRSAFSLYYLAQGIGVGPMLSAMAPYLAEQNLSPAAIGGFVSVVFLPWSLKLVAGPVMDRWAYLPMGRRRPWILLAQGWIVLSCAGIALIPDPLHHLTWLIAACAAANVGLALQDVAIDGMAVDVLPENEQVGANALMFGFQAVGMAVSTAGAGWLLRHHGINATFAASALVFCVFILLPLLVRERPGERLLPWTAGAASPLALAQQPEGWGQIGRTLGRGLILPASLLALALLFVYRSGFGVTIAIMPVAAVQQLGWTASSYSQLKAASDLAGAVLSMVLSGFLGSRLGTARLMQWVGALAALLLLGMGLGRAGWEREWVIVGFVGLFTVFNIMLSVLSGALMMSLCWNRVAATQFGLYMAVSNFGLSGGAALVGPLTRSFSYPGILMLMAAAYFFLVAVLAFLRPREHHARVAELERAEAARSGSA